MPAESELPMRTMKNILVGVDFSESSGKALREALRIAARQGGTVHALHVIDVFVAAELEDALSPMQRNIRDGLVADAEKAWREYRQQIAGAENMPIEVYVEHRVLGLLRKASGIQADLMVLGTGGEHGPIVGAGTVATACVRRASSDVLLVREQAERIGRIVAAVDFSNTSARALERAAQMAAMDQSELHVLHVFDPPWQRLHYMAATPQADPSFLKQYQEGLERRLKDFTAKTVEPLGPLNLHIALFDGCRYRSGIVEYANQVQADLICLGTRGRSNIRDLLLGSTAEKALVNSACSVLAVKPDSLADTVVIE